MNLHSFTLQSLSIGIALLASASAMAQEAPPRPGGARTPSEEIKLLPPDEVAKLPARVGQQGDGKRLPQPDNPLDPNRPRTSDKEPAKIKPAENAVVPAENEKKVLSKEERQAKKARDAKAGKDGKKEPAKIKPAENAAVPAENTGKPKAKDKQANEQQAAPRRAVQATIATMPSAPAPVTYGPALAPQPSVPTSVPSTTVTQVRPMPSRPAIVNSCDAGGCTDTSGVRYNGAAGGTMIGPGGKACHSNGVTMQC